MKKLISAITSIALAASLLPSSISAASSSLKDISNHWAKASIMQAVNDGYVKGYPGDVFKANGLVTRAEFASILAKAVNLPETKEAVIFTDIANHWAADAITKDERMGVISASDYGNKFNPNQAMTRIELSNWLKNVLLQKEGYLEAWNDVANTIVPITEFYKGNLSETQKQTAALMIGTGIIAGDQNGRYNPNANVTRAEMVTVLYRFLAVKDKPADSFRALNELREVGMTGTNMGTATNRVVTKDTSWTNVIGKDQAKKYDFGTRVLGNVIFVDFSTNPEYKSVYTDMFKFTNAEGVYGVFSFNTYTLKVNSVTSSTMTNSNATPISAIITIMPTKADKYNYQLFNGRDGFGWLKKGLPAGVWSYSILMKNASNVDSFVAKDGGRVTFYKE
ncbi:S-layer homology domain-containing protein [Paenibacillus sp. JX-17]|uniref:S-layer homology domain-containing protein n=1 Tax=Paenibacillus lacisoli TaxID=3064525 RepID=A0ABT9CKL2_9BACL|nr:S-layer homology domain-containing protein [Paenibacillus sp. JX-17]MDO7908442.1 S-layer homology domain-containing protein [Paenibacillus sp. JX-17]